MISAEILGSILHTIAGTFGFCCNLLLMFLLLFKSPKEMRTYSWLLMNMVISDTITCFCTLFVEPRIIPYKEDVIYVANELCNLVGSKAVCWIGYASLLCFFCHQNWSLLGNFLYRLYILYRPTPPPKKLIPLITVICIPTIIGEYLMIPYALEMVDVPVEEKLFYMYPNLTTEGKVVFIARNATTDYRPFTISVMVLMFIFPFTIAVLIIRAIILRKLRNTTLMADSTKRTHLSFLKALTLQALLPIFYMIGSSIFMFEWFSGILMPPVEYMVPLLLGSIAAMNPVLSLYFVVSFRKQVLNTLFCRFREEIRVDPNPSFTPSSQRPFTDLVSSSVAQDEQV